MTTKKLLAVLMSAIMMLSVLFIIPTALAEDIGYYTDGDYWFTLTTVDGKDVAELVTVNPQADPLIKIPATVTTNTADPQTYLVGKVDDGIYDAISQIRAVDISGFVGLSDEDYAFVLAAYKDVFKDLDKITQLYFPAVLADFAAAVKADPAAALSAAGITTGEALTDYIAAAYYKYTTAICEAMGLKYIEYYVSTATTMISDELISNSNGALYTNNISSFYTNVADVLGSVPMTLLVLPATKTVYAANNGTARISGYAFTNRDVEKLGIPNTVTSFGKGTYVAAGETAAAEHNTFDTANVAYVENRSKAFDAIKDSGLIKSGIEVYSVYDFDFSQYVTAKGGTFSEVKGTRIEEATSILEKLTEFFNKIIAFFKQLFERIKG